MGNGQSCEGDLSRDVNICKLGHCISKLEGRASNSASASDIWRVSIRPGVTYKGLPVTCGWLKVFVSKADSPVRKTEGLRYELRVYRDVVSPLVDKRVCPNFVRYLSSAENCSYEDMIGIITSQKMEENQFLRSLCHMTTLAKDFPHGQRPQRPAINDRVTSSQLKEVDRLKLKTRKLKFGMLLTQDRRVVTLREWVNASIPIPDYACMMLQLTAALRAMELSQFVHNDMHLGNILMELNNTSCNVRYEMDDHQFGICTKFRVAVFDFDRAVVTQLGPNELTKSHSNYAQKFVAGRDLSSVLALLFKRSSVEQAMLLERAFNVKAVALMKDFKGRSPSDFAQFQKGSYELVGGKQATQTNAFLKFDRAPIIDSRASMLEAMDYLHTKVVHICSDADTDFTYVCNSNMFGPDGTLLV
jgi:hypothetical protein